MAAADEQKNRDLEMILAEVGMAAPHPSVARVVSRVNMRCHAR
jgi:hypothetical protein